MIKVELAGGVDGLPSHLVCGKCSGQVDATWNVYLDKKKRPIGAIGTGVCKPCSVPVVSIATNDPKFMRDATRLAEAEFDRAPGLQ